MAEPLPEYKKGKDYIGITVSYFCHDGRGNYLLAKRGTQCRDEHGRWDCGGGAMEFGERSEETLAREIEEEYGVSPITYEFLGAREAHREHDGRPTHWISLDYKVLVDREKAYNAEPHKFDEIGWFPLAAFPSPLHSMLPDALKRFRDRL